MPPLSPDEARRRLAAARTAHLATVRADGRPHLVPIVFAVDGDLVYAIADPKPKRSLDLLRHRNIAANPAVSLLVDEYDESWRGLWWVRVDGMARIVESGPGRETAIRLLRRKYPQYATWTTPFGAAMVLQIERWASWTI
ncbi:MAG: TIGR03668 family PPOX class F420-dependent oxidoreductase [Candidatus Limnocylindria bacterium]